MIIYLASSAPGNESQRERGMLDIEKRLLKELPYAVLEISVGRY